MFGRGRGVWYWLYLATWLVDCPATYVPVAAAVFRGLRWAWGPPFRGARLVLLLVLSLCGFEQVFNRGSLVMSVMYPYGYVLASS